MLSLVHTRNDEDILTFPEIPGILAGYGTHIVDHIRGVTGDPYLGIIVDIYGIEIDLGFRLREILSQPLNRLLSRTTNFIVILDF
jgi:hypothetical protein